MISKKSIYIGIEGPSFSGKSTLLHDLGGIFFREKIIEGYSYYAGGTKDFRKVPFRNENDAKENIHDFIDWEKKRISDAEKIARTNRLIYFDRTIFSTILLQKMIKDMYPHFHNAFEYNVDAVIAAVENKEIVLPDKIIYIKLIDEKTFITRSKRGVSVPLFSEFSSLKYLELYYLKILNIFYPNKNIVIHSKNGLINRMKLALSAQKFGKENSDFQNEYIDPKKLYLL